MRIVLHLAVGLAIILAPAIGTTADTHDVNFIASVDFGALKTFAIRSGQITSEKPEIDNRLFRQRMEDSIRAALLQKGLQEAGSHPDMTVTWSYGDKNVSGVERTGPTRIPDTAQARGYVVPGAGPSPTMYTEGTLVIDVLDASNSLVWHGTWRDQEQSGPTLSRNLSDDAMKLLREFPPRRKQGLFSN
jgi:hypothetical protein